MTDFSGFLSFPSKTAAGQSCNKGTFTLFLWNDVAHGGGFLVYVVSSVAEGGIPVSADFDFQTGLSKFLVPRNRVPLR